MLLCALMERMSGWIKRLLYPSWGLSTSLLQRRFAQRVVVVTGASRGIGAALVRLLQSYRVHFVLVARSEAELQQLAQEVEALGASAECYAVDLREREALRDLCRILSERYPRVDYFFANAGKSIFRSLEDSQERLHDFDRTIDLNYRAMVYLAQALYPALAVARGVLVYTSSVSLLYPPAPHWAAYHASKGAADIWLRTAREEWALRGVRVRIAYMPLVHTSMADVNPRYVHLPGYTAEEAATRLIRLAVGRRSSYAPWWARLSSPLSFLFRRVVTYAYRRVSH